MIEKEGIKESKRRKNVLEQAYKLYLMDGTAKITPEMQVIMDKYINLEIDYKEFRKLILESVGIKNSPLSDLDEDDFDLEDNDFFDVEDDE